MGRSRRSTLLLVLVLASSLALGACGESEDAALLPGGTASEISSNLDQVRQLAGEGECVGAQDAALEVSDQVDALGGVDRKLKQALREGALRLEEVVAACQEAEPEEEETSPSLSTEAEEVESEAGEKREKPEGPEKEPPGQEKKAEREEGEDEQEEPPPTETPVEEQPASGGTPSGGVSPSTPAEGE